MRLELLYNPRLLIERLAVESLRYRRLGKLKGTIASSLLIGHIDSLELLELTQKQSPQIIYDIGANVGTWTALAKATLPSSIIYAFEPLIIHCKIFKEQIIATHKDVSANIHLHQVALGATKEQKNIKVASFSDASSLLSFANATYQFFGITQEREELVNVVVLDDYVISNKLPLPDLIKLDIQGYELEALKGANECLRHAKYIIIEVSFVEFYQDQPLFHDIVNFLAAKNFYLYALGVNTPTGKELSQTDALFIRKT
ncbi:FkbM family methyltransferase [Pseudanabaena yagii]|uniref:FkbM family methyltransferase n=1 Tax=Pseudanabaena yagii GIHE-NHR1 TaxID=2722753 RepID=A0ABX1LKI6_9CYAN|nr:FkbM family methyltransferase [Pseudanabaena yagii]NMF56630.1 FkbM family methyltransferase [Pseudanabaena yagii GIHE-NHR1]